MELEDTIKGRRTVRKFKDVPLSNDTINKLLWAAEGVTSEKGKRTTPSAGGLYPLDVYVISIPEDKIRISTACRQGWISNAGVIFVIVAQYLKMEVKYGNRGVRYTLIEVGHMAQNVLLLAHSLGLGAAAVGAFKDRDISMILNLPVNNCPVLIITIGEKA